MIIKYPAGRTVEGFLLTRHENSMRVALQGGQDVAEFIEVEGNWISENLEPVEITFEWQRQPHTAEVPTEADFICPKDLAERLVSLLETDSDEDHMPPLRHLTAGTTIM
jgi:hypothetical protein